MNSAQNLTLDQSPQMEGNETRQAPLVQRQIALFKRAMKERISLGTDTVSPFIGLEDIKALVDKEERNKEQYPGSLLHLYSDLNGEICTTIIQQFPSSWFKNNEL